MELYRCDNNRNPRTVKTFRYQCQQPIIGQYVRVNNFDLTDPNNLEGFYNKFELCELHVTGKRMYHLNISVLS
jgi:hypothetical protein